MNTAGIFERLVVRPQDNDNVSVACIKLKILCIAVNRAGIHKQSFRARSRRQEHREDEARKRSSFTLENAGESLRFHLLFTHITYAIDPQVSFVEPVMARPGDGRQEWTCEKPRALLAHSLQQGLVARPCQATATIFSVATPPKINKRGRFFC